MMEKYQTFTPRLVALLIDGFIMMPLAVLDDWFRRAEFSSAFFYVWIPLSVMVAPVYKILMHGFYGQTLGKMFMNVKVLNASEEPLKFSQAVIRETPQIIFTAVSIYIGIAFLGVSQEDENFQTAYKFFMTFAGVWGLADILTFFTNNKRRALHDFLAGTVVVKTNVE